MKIIGLLNECKGELHDSQKRLIERNLIRPYTKFLKKLQTELKVEEINLKLFFEKINKSKFIKTLIDY